MQKMEIQGVCQRVRALIVSQNNLYKLALTPNAGCRTFILTYSRSVVCAGRSAAGCRACQYATANTKPCALVLYMMDIALAHAQATIHCMNN